MKINITFPSVMKMMLSTELEVAEPVSLPEVREKILEFFWEVIGPLSRSGIHGSPDEVVLQDRYDGVEILTEIELERRVSESHNFQVVFKGH